MGVVLRWAAVPSHRRTLLAVALAVCLLGSGARVSGQRHLFVSVAQDDTCPLTLLQVRMEPRVRSLDLAVAGTVANPTGRAARSLVFTAAIVDASGRVTDLHLQPLDLVIQGGEHRSFRVVFERFSPNETDSVVFGIQAVRWSRADEWRGALRVVTAPAVLARTGVAR